MWTLRSAALLALCVIALPAQAATFEVSAWLPYWHEESATQRALEKLDYLTEVNPFVYTVNPDGTLKDLVGINEEPWKSFLAKADARGVRIVPTIMWFDKEAMHRILSNYESRVKLEDDILALVEEHNFDGIDIDFEHKLYETRDYFSTFLKGLQMRFPKKWVMCTIESRTPLASQYEYPYPAGAGMYVNDYEAFAKYCDRVRIMAYDQGLIDIKLNAESTSKPYVPVADVRWVEKTLQEALKSIPKHKISIGVPTYGYEYVVTPKATGGFSYERVRAFNQPYAYDLLVRYAARVVRNVAGELSFTYIPTASGTVTPETKPGEPTVSAVSFGALSPSTVEHTGAVAAQTSYNIVWWSDAYAIKNKLDLAKRYGVRGISVFKVDGEEDPALWDVLTRVR